mmetsp:Transcript_28448/g.78366  ORF Transcript_28448/g.78366 Transcript_28448/m.78366 type:complete len:374 (+) Transcript_28448:210-1331(+)
MPPGHALCVFALHERHECEGLRFFGAGPSRDARADHRSKGREGLHQRMFSEDRAERWRTGRVFPLYMDVCEASKRLERRVALGDTGKDERRITAPVGRICLAEQPTHCDVLLRAAEGRKQPLRSRATPLAGDMPHQELPGVALPRGERRRRGGLLRLVLGQPHGQPRTLQCVLYPFHVDLELQDLCRNMPQRVVLVLLSRLDPEEQGDVDQRPMPKPQRFEVTVQVVADHEGVRPKQVDEPRAGGFEVQGRGPHQGLARQSRDWRAAVQKSTSWLHDGVEQHIAALAHSGHSPEVPGVVTLLRIAHVNEGRGDGDGHLRPAVPLAAPLLGRRRADCALRPQRCPKVWVGHDAAQEPRPLQRPRQQFGLAINHI